MADANVFVVGTGWHTQIYLKATDLQGGMRAFAISGARYVGFGFAQRAFILQRNHSIATYLRGFFQGLVPSPGVIIVTWLTAPPQAACGAAHTVGLHANRAQLARLNQVLWADLVHAEGRPERIAPGDYPGSAFYAATQRYDLTFTCNSWTDATLHAAGLGMPAEGTVFASQTMTDARDLAAGQ